MADQDLERASELKNKIQELKSFILTCKKVWMGKLIKRSNIFKSNVYSTIKEAGYFMDTEMKNKILKVLEDKLVDLKRQLEEI